MPREVDPATERPIVALNALIRERAAPEQMRGDFAAYLREHGVQGEDLESMVSVGAARFLVYRQLVQNRMRNATRDFIPRTVARRGRNAYGEDFAAFMEERAARSYYLRDVPSEFVAWVKPRWRADADVPDYMCDLAEHELLEYDVRNDPRGGETPTGLALALDRPLLFDGAARLMQYDHAVHRLKLDPEDRTEPDRMTTELLVYRDRDGKVRYLELTEFASLALAELMGEGLAVADGLRRACERLRQPLDDDKLATAAQLLADLAERGIMLGAVSDSGSA